MEPPRNPFDEHMGYRLVTIDDEHVVIEGETGPTFHNPMGTTHGSFYCGLMESTMGYLVGYHNRDKYCTNIDLQVSFIRPSRTGRLRATSSIVKRGSKVWLLESKVEDEAGGLIAVSRSSFLTLPRER